MTIRLEDYSPPQFEIISTHLHFMLAPEKTIVRSKLHIKPLGKAHSLALDGEDLTLLGVWINGVETKNYVLSTGLLTLDTPTQAFDLEIETQINPQGNTKLEGLYRSNNTYCTQCEAQGFRRITYFLDRPDVLSVYTVKIEGDTPLLLSNGNCIERGKNYAVWHDPHPKPCYLFALVAGDLACVKDSFTTMSGRNVALEIYVEHGRETQCDYAMDSLKRSMRWDEKVFNLEYDLDVFMIVAVSDFNMGAMENKGLNIFNDKYVLANPKTATDADYANIEGIIAHEYFHNWTGNRITCRDWFQLSLKEGLTVFRDQEFSSDERSRPVKRIEDVRILKASQFVEDAGPLAHPVRPRAYQQINNFYTATVYNKGAEVIRMLKLLLGDAGFKKGLDLYFKRHDGQATTIELYIKCFEEANERDLSQFCLWYEQEGTPLVKARTEFEGDNLYLYLEQVLRNPTHKPQVIPLNIALFNREGHELASEIVTLDQFTGKFVFEGLMEQPILSLNRGFSAPITIEYETPDEELTLLAMHESDAYNRWQAVQSYVLRLMKREKQDFAPFTALYGKLIDDAAQDPAFFAHCLNLPSEEDIAREIGANINPEAIYNKRNALLKAVCQANATKASALYESLKPAKDFSPSATQAGVRALRLAALRIMLCADVGENQAISHFEIATNMTDQVGALALLNLYGAPHVRKKALATFYHEHEHDAIVLDKWLALQAITKTDDTIKHIQHLLALPMMKKFNPNRFRALVGSFGMANQLQFNRADGLGYEFYATQVLYADSVNPQTAARLVSAFRSFKALEPTRRELAHQALTRISQANLSSDVKEMVERMLG